MRNITVKDTYIDDNVGTVYQSPQILNLSNSQKKLRFAEINQSYQIDRRVRAVEEQAEREFLADQRKQREEKQIKEQENALQEELAYSSHNLHLLSLKQKQNPRNMFSIGDYIEPPYKNQHKSSEFYGREELANQLLESSVNQKYRNPNILRREMKMRDDVIQQNGVVNERSDEIVLNYLNNDDFNFNQKAPKSFVERKIDQKVNHTEQSSHFHTHYGSKNCSACQRKQQIEENKMKQLIYNGVNLNFLLLQCKESLQKRHFSKSEDSLLSAISKGIDHADIYYLLGETYRLQGRFKEAEKQLLQALLFQFHSPYTYNSLGQVYMELDQYDRAIKLFKKFAELNEEAKTYFNIGVCLVRQKELLDSVVYFGRAIEIDQTEGTFYLHRAETYESLGFIDMALKDYRFFKKCTPKWRDSLEDQLSNLMRQNRNSEAKNLKNYILKLESA